MPFRIDVPSAGEHTLDRMVDLGALDVEAAGDRVAAILPDSVTADMVHAAFGREGITVSEAAGRDGDSVWLLSSRRVQIGGLAIASATEEAAGDVLRLADSRAFGTGHHPTTALCLEALTDLLEAELVASVLDVGTGSGILALAALRMGVPRAVGLDIEDHALSAAAENARLNGLSERLHLVAGGPEAVQGTWPLVLANVLAAPLMDMASQLVRRVGKGGRLILSGIPSALMAEVRGTYQHFGMRFVDVRTREGWTMLTAQAGW